MIEYDYQIVRDEGDRKTTFKPNQITPKLDNIAYIEGPNSCGKSTLLNIFALAFYGQKVPTIHGSLKEKIDSLMDIKHQELTFDIRITNSDGSLELLSGKKYPNKSDIVVRESINGQKAKILTPEVFFDKYQLIYDIPVDPTKRLDQLTLDIKEAQDRYGNKVGAFTEFIRETIQDIRNSKDPNKIEELGNRKNQFVHEKKEAEKIHNLYKKDLDILEKYTYARFYQQYDSEYNELNDQLKKFEKSKTKKQKDLIKSSLEYKQLTGNLGTKLNEMQQNFSKVTIQLKSLLPKEKHHLNIWAGINLNDIYNDLKFNIYLEPELTHFICLLSDQLEEEKKKDSIKVGEVFEQLIAFLEDHSELNITLPGGKKINEFIEELKIKKKEYDPEIAYSQNLKEAYNSLEELRTLKRDIEQDYLSQIKELKEKYPHISGKEIGEDLTQQRILGLKEEISKCEMKKDFYYAKWVDKGKKSLASMNDTRCIWVDYAKYNEEQLLASISKQKEEIEEYDQKIQEYEFRIKRLDDVIESLEKKDEHPYQQFLEDLEERIFTASRSLDQKLRSHFNEYITELKNKNAKHTKDPDKKKYHDAIFKYLARKVNIIRHGDDEHHVKYIDLIDRVIITDGGKKILFTDMGTGQSQSAYLTGKLNISGDRKIIALFDEVAMMDDTSLAPIYSKFRELYASGQLLAGIVVQKGNKVKIESKLICD